MKRLQKGKGGEPGRSPACYLLVTGERRRCESGRREDGAGEVPKRSAPSSRPRTGGKQEASSEMSFPLGFLGGKISHRSNQKYQTSAFTTCLF